MAPLTPSVSVSNLFLRILLRLMIPHIAPCSPVIISRRLCTTIIIPPFALSCASLIVDVCGFLLERSFIMLVWPERKSTTWRLSPAQGLTGSSLSIQARRFVLTIVWQLLFRFVRRQTPAGSEITKHSQSVEIPFEARIARSLALLYCDVMSSSSILQLCCVVLSFRSLCEQGGYFQYD